MQAAQAVPCVLRKRNCGLPEPLQGQKYFPDKVEAPRPPLIPPPASPFGGPDCGTDGESSKGRKNGGGTTGDEARTDKKAENQRQKLRSKSPGRAIPLRKNPFRRILGHSPAAPSLCLPPESSPLPLHQKSRPGPRPASAATPPFFSQKIFPFSCRFVKFIPTSPRRMIKTTLFPRPRTPLPPPANGWHARLFQAFRSATDLPSRRSSCDEKTFPLDLLPFSPCLYPSIKVL